MNQHIKFHLQNPDWLDTHPPTSESHAIAQSTEKWELYAAVLRSIKRTWARQCALCRDPQSTYSRPCSSCPFANLVGTNCRQYPPIRDFALAIENALNHARHILHDLETLRLHPNAHTKGYNP